MTQEGILAGDVVFDIEANFKREHDTEKGHALTNCDPEHSHDAQLPGSQVDATTKTRFFTMFFLIGSFFLVELIVGIISQSITLLADSMHMLSDLIALVIGFWAVNMATRQSNTVATYGFKRAEVVGALINGVFLLTVCFNIVLEAVHRFIEMEETEALEENIDEVIIVGALGLGINIVGLIVFAATGHGHSHGGKACHGHHGHGHSHDVPVSNPEAHELDHNHDHGHGHGHSHGHCHGHGHTHEHGHDHGDQTTSRESKSGDMNVNLRGVFLHMMGDALGSVGVMISAFVIKYVRPEDDPKGYRFLADPVCSLVIVVILFKTTWPFVTETAQTLMQTVPEGFSLLSLRSRLLSDRQLLDLGLVGVHDLHVWALNDESLVGTLHAVIQTGSGHSSPDLDKVVGPEATNQVVLRVQEIFHDSGVAAVTAQVEFVAHGEPRASDEGCEVDGKCLIPRSLRSPVGGPLLTPQDLASPLARRMTALATEWAATPRAGRAFRGEGRSKSLAVMLGAGSNHWQQLEDWNLSRGASAGAATATPSSASYRGRVKGRAPIQILK